MNILLTWFLPLRLFILALVSSIRILSELVVIMFFVFRMIANE